jgi:hypothetical protein
LRDSPSAFSFATSSFGHVGINLPINILINTAESPEEVNWLFATFFQQQYHGTCHIRKHLQTAKTALPSPADRIQFLTDAGIKPPANTPAKELIERCATLAWSRDSLANTIDPETWPTTLDPVLLPVLLALYAVPPHHGAAPAPSYYRRLADVIESPIPVGQPGAPPPQPAAAAPLAPGAPIYIARPAGPPPPPLAAGTRPSPALLPPPPATPPQ